MGDRCQWLEFLLWVQLDPAAPAAAPVAVTVPARAGPQCLGNRDLPGIRQAVASESFSSGKLGVLETALKGRQVCAAEVVELLGLFDFAKDKLSALRLLRPGLSDMNNAYQIYGAFDFDADKKKAKEILDR